MSNQVNTTAVSNFTNNVDLALAQTTSKFEKACTPENASGELHEIVNLIGAAKPNYATTRHGDTEYVDTPHARRWMAKPYEAYFADLIDTADKLAAKIDLQGAYTRTAAATIQRAKDDAFLAGFYGTALTGKTGTTGVTFPAGNIIAVTVGAAAATGLNMAKLRAARALMVANLVDTEAEELYIALTSKQSDNLLNEVQATSADFIKSNGGMTVTQTGRLGMLFGFNFIECEFGNSSSFNNTALTLDSNSYRRVPVWAKSGMALGTWQGLNISIDRLPQKRNSIQVYAGITVAASRTQEGKCLQILCSES